MKLIEMLEGIVLIILGLPLILCIPFFLFVMWRFDNDWEAQYGDY